jgi:DNA-binding winged helix-turn-helix (wHTH) protein/TolB-like protein
MPVETQHLYEFGPFRLDPAEHRLLQAGRPVPLTPKAFQTLLVLVENQGRLVEKEELLRRIWPDTFVEESTLAQNIFTLRKQLGQDGDEPVYIETVPKRGYRFAAPVKYVEPAAGRREVIASAASTAAERRGPIGKSYWAAAGIAVVAIVGLSLYLATHTQPKGSHRIMLVVLPVQNLTGDAARDYVADGLTEELIAQLGSLNPTELGVIARTSAMAYKQSSKTVGQIGRDLRADYALECSLRESADATRFTAQLIRISDETHVWAHSFERPRGDLLALQRELARIVAGEIRITVTPEGQTHLSTPANVNAEAYDLYVQGKFHWNERSAREMRAAIPFYQQAIEKDPGFAPAYVGLADSYSMLATMREAAPNEVMPKAKDALLKALALDGALAEAHTSLGWVLEVFDWDWSGSERELQKAIELGPNDATAHHRYAIHLASMGRLPEALAQMRDAQRLDPLSPVIFTSTAWVLLRGRRPDDAMRECRRALDLDPKFVRGHLCLGEAYEQKGDPASAASEFLRGKLLAGDTPEVLDALKDATAREGYQGYFRTRLAQLLVKSKTAYVSPYDLADTYVRLGDKEHAFYWLHVAYEEHSPYLANLQIEPRLDALRADPRFAELVAQVGLNKVTVTPISSQAAGAAN